VVDGIDVGALVDRNCWLTTALRSALPLLRKWEDGQEPDGSDRALIGRIDRRLPEFSERGDSVTRICPRCQAPNTSLSGECMACGWRPEGVDPGHGTEAHSQIHAVRGSEKHTKGGIAS
jgi:hypothetical protein